MTKTWKCDLCGYVHNGTEPPESCPVCGADSSHFSELKIQTSSVPKAATEAWQCSICDHISHGITPPEFCPVCGAAKAFFHPYFLTETTATPENIQKVVIFGAGIAGITAAEEARRQASQVEITLVSREKSLPYFRLNLTRFLAGEVEESDLLIQQQEWFDEQKINYLTGEAQTIDRDAQKVTLRDGKELEYDRLIMANGAHPFIPPIPGANRDGVMVLRTLDNAREMIDSLHPGCRAVCIGGGLLGLETRLWMASATTTPRKGGRTTLQRS